MITGDFETRSALPIKAGAWAYSEHPSTQILCFCWSYDDDPLEEVHVWHRAHPAFGIEQSPFPQELADRVAAGEIFEAHNSFFEFCIWNHVFRKECPGLPELKLENMRCTAAKAASFSLPRALENVVKVLKLAEQKDMEGSAAMMRLTKPRKLRAAEKKRLIAEGINPDTYWDFPESEEDIRRNWSYCQQDVRAEEGLSKVLRDLSPQELAYWQMDQRMNARGIYCDMNAVLIAVNMATEERDRLNAIIKDMTGGYVPKGSSRKKLVEWVNSQGVPLENTRKETLDALLGGGGDDEEGEDSDDDAGSTEDPAEDATTINIDLPAHVRQVLAIARDVNRSSLAKYQQMILQVSSGNRLRDMMLYCGASRTGRWSGKGVQPHNFIRGFSKEMEEAWQDILLDDPEALRLLWGSVMEVLSKATRGAMRSSPGKDLMVADFAAIEARVLMWLAEDEEALGVFYRGEDIYLEMATAIFGYPCNKKEHPFERQVGKQAVLGLGYQMGAEKFMDTCHKYPELAHLKLDFLEKVVKIYRKDKFPNIVSFWDELNQAVIQAVESYDPATMSRGPEIKCRRVSCFMWGQFLHIRLPSGRLLSYFRPQIKTRVSWRFPAIRNSDGEKSWALATVDPGVSEAVARSAAARVAKLADKTMVPNGRPAVHENKVMSFWTEDSKTRQWVRKATYGGELVENITQATARDLMAAAMYRVDQHPDYDILLSVHDELIAECDAGTGDVKEFEALMAETPDWAEGCPVAAEGWKGRRYRK